MAAELQARSGANVQVCVADLATRAGLEVVAQRLASDARLELLVNNAGIGSRGAFWASPLEELLRMHELNVLAVLELSHAAVRAMVPRRSGAIINVASVAGFVRRAQSVGYGATKSWVLAFSEALHLDLQQAGSPVQVQALCPGFTYTEFHDVMNLDRKRVASRSLWLDADFVVAASLRGLSRRQLFVVPGWRYRLFVNLIATLPPGIRVLFEEVFQRKYINNK